jgi:hypothetical protein
MKSRALLTSGRPNHNSARAAALASLSIVTLKPVAEETRRSTSRSRQLK